MENRNAISIVPQHITEHGVTRPAFEFKFVVVEESLNAVSRSPVEVFYSCDYTWDALVQKISSAFARAEGFVSQWGINRKLLDCWSYLTISDGEGRTLDMELDEHDEFIRDIQACVTSLVDWVKEALMAMAASAGNPLVEGM